jgi:uncharacterized membrane protein YecN with MAPEG domain
MTIYLYAGLLAGFYLFLSVQVIRSRRANKTAIGDGDNLDIKRRIRAHGNFMEYTPLFLILLFLAEQCGLYAWCVHILGVTFFLGRLSHAYSLLKHEQYEDGKIVAMPIWRIRGMMCTFNTIGTLVAIVLIQYVLSFFPNLF